MYAIVEIAGQQFKVEEGKKIFVNRLENEEGTDVDFDKVLLIDNDGKILIGEPYLKGAFIQARVMEEVKGDKVIVFKKKRRKGYKVKKGHRQQYSHIEILKINEKGFVKKEAKTAKPKAAAETKTTKKTSTSKAAPAKTAVKKEADTKKTAAAAKKSAEKPKASAAKKPAATKAKTADKTAETKTTAAKKPAAKKTTEAKTTAAKKTAAKKPAAKKTSAAASKTAEKKTATTKTGTAKPKKEDKAKSSDTDKKTDK